MDLHRMKQVCSLVLQRAILNTRRPKAVLAVATEGRPSHLVSMATAAF